MIHSQKCEEIMFLCLRSLSWGLTHQLLCRPCCFLSKAFRFSSTVFAVCLSAALSLPLIPLGWSPCKSLVLILVLSHLCASLPLYISNFSPVKMRKLLPAYLWVNLEIIQWLPGTLKIWSIIEMWTISVRGQCWLPFPSFPCSWRPLGPHLQL